MQKEKEEKKPKECLEDIISRTFDEVKQRMCDDYCRFTAGKNADEIEDLWDSDICNNCPLNRLYTKGRRKMGEYMDVETYEEYFKENGCLARKVYHSYVILLTEKNGSEVEAVRLHTDKKKGNQDFFDELKTEFPELDKWNIKGVWRLYEDDFRK